MSEAMTIISDLKRSIKSGPIPAFKHALHDYRQIQSTSFFSEEASDYSRDKIAHLLKDHANFIDEVLNLAWQQYDWQHPPLALIAVGGYGRGELHPYSDIDLLILLENNDYDKHEDNIQQFVTLLWDIGLEVGHSVRSLPETQHQAREDITVITSLLEGRPLCGDFSLFSKVQQLIAPDIMWDQREFFEAKITEQEKRHKSSAHTAFSLEPNVKSSPGGLRDIQTIMWIAKRQFGEVNFDNLAALNFLTFAERDILRSGERKLWNIRFALHLISGKDENRLLFEYQPKLAKIFGYEDGDQLAVEKFMQSYYRAAMVVNTTSELLLQYFEEVFTSNEDKNTIGINEKFQIRNSHIQVTHDQVFNQHPEALLEIFLHIGSDPRIKGTGANTIRLIRNSLGLIDNTFRNTPEISRIFLEILRTSEKLSSQLTRMERYGILGTYLPEFGRIIGQMQFDLFHIYTVDAHTLEVVRNMRRFRYKNEEQRFPVAAHIYPRLPKIELLFIAGLYHDIGKGQGGDHSILGIEIARRFCARHSLPTWDTNLVCWLVENHLIMSSTSQKKDTTDPEVIHEFALFVQDQVRLDYLYALTVADITATNPTLWNSWRASLMRQLYIGTKKALKHGLENYVDRSEYISDTQAEVRGRLVEQGLSESRTNKIWQCVDDDYFVRESMTDILWHTQAIADHHLDDGPLILIRDSTSRRENEGATQIFIYTHRSEKLFAAIVSAIDHLDLDILDAKIASSESGLVFDTFTVLESNGEPVGTDKNRLNTIASSINEALNNLDNPITPMQRRTSRALKTFKVQIEVVSSQKSDGTMTLLEVITPDRQGLLSVIANTLVEMKVRLHSAKITTLGDRVEDSFYITDQFDQAIIDADGICKRVRTSIDNYVSKVSH